MAKHKSPKKPTKQMHQNQPPKPPSWAVMRGIFACKDLQTQQPQILKQDEDKKPQEQKQKQKQQEPNNRDEGSKKQYKKQQKQEEAHNVDHEGGSKKQYKKMKCSGSLCSNTKVMHRPDLSASPEAHKRRALGSSSSSSHNETASSSRSMKPPLRELSTNSSSLSTASSSNSSSLAFRAMPFRRFSGCYECRMVVDPVLGFTRDPSLRATICSCPDCGEIFMKPDSLHLHQAVRHAVSELGAEDTSKNIVEIIFQSSWLKKQTAVCRIERILKVQNTQRTIARFEEYRDGIKAKATRVASANKGKHPRCVADGNELLRFHSTTLGCPLGLNGSSNLCASTNACSACSIIKNGFRLAGDGSGILTTATSGKAHDRAGGGERERAMLVCRVIAGRVKKTAAPEVAVSAAGEDYDSVGGGGLGVYSNLDELYVFNPKAILPCFVVIYTGF